MVLVTGSTGFVGRNTVQRLAQDGKKVRCLVRQRPDKSSLQYPGVEFAVGDVTDPVSLEEAMHGIDQIVHLVAVIREYPRKGITFEKINVQGTRNVAAAAKKSGAKRLLHLSAIGARADTDFPYLRSKWLGEQAVQRSGIDWTILRSSIIIGPGDEFLRELKNPITMSPVMPIIGNGKARFQYIWVEDVARCISISLDAPINTQRLIEIAGPEHVTYEETMDMIARTLGKKRLKAHIPVPVMSPLVKLMNLILPRPPLTSNQLKMLDLDNITALDSVKRNFGFEPKPISEIIGYLRKAS